MNQKNKIIKDKQSVISLLALYYIIYIVLV